MEHRETPHTNPSVLRVAIALLLALTLLLSFGLYAFYKKSTAITAELAQKTQVLESTSTMLEELEQKYAMAEEDNAELLALFEEERSRNEEFEDQIEDLSGTVGKLDKLSKIDPELLQKYSKVYFLNEHYAPGEVDEIDPKFVRNDGMKEYVHAEVEPFLDDLLKEAEDDGVSLFVTSGYRSFDEQAGLKGTYTVQYGFGANAFSADQGYSEHQLGTAVDFSSDEVNGALTVAFEDSPAFAWLEKNAHKYGFTLSYPKDNGYYVYEPWHWRFVGTELADDLRDDNIHFYDLEQRKIDTYLISIFD